MRALWLCLFLAACGGGGGGGGTAPPPAPPADHFVHFAYFGTGESIDAVADHVSITFEMDWANHVNLPAHMDTARAKGLKTIIGVERYLYANGRYLGNAEAVRPILDQLRKLGMLDLVIGFYPADEPDLHYSDSDVRSANKSLRSLCQDFPELGSCLLVVIYSDHQPPAPDTYDWLGTDGGRYGTGPHDFPLLAGQRLIIIPGGASPWREPPDAFVAYANAHAEVVAIIPFLYLDYVDFGIGTNGMLPAYCKAGRSLTMKPNAPCPG